MDTLEIQQNGTLINCARMSMGRRRVSPHTVVANAIEDITFVLQSDNPSVYHATLTTSGGVETWKSLQLVDPCNE